MPPVRSAALLAYRWDERGALLVFIAHMGGPLWRSKDEGGWSIPKGLYQPDEPPELAARREFAEEIGVLAPAGELLDLGECRQRSGKVIRTFAVAAPADLAFVASNEFQMEWPRGSGRVVSYPEIDRAQWFPLAVAERKLVSGQVPILQALAAAVSPVAGH